MASLDVAWAQLDNPALYMVGGSVAFIVTMLVMPPAIRKLHGAKIVGRDRNKAGQPEVAEMGGLGVFAGFTSGALALLAFVQVDATQEKLVLAVLLLAAGAAMTGILDDLISLQQRFKALLPIAFTIPLALFVTHHAVATPWGDISFGVWFPILLLPLAITCGANGFNMLEGFNGLGAGMGIIMAVAIGALGWMHGNLLGWLVLVPLATSLLAFLNFNWFPAQIFPGDTMTLLVGAALVSGAVLSEVEFWAAFLFLPYIVEFFLKARTGFKGQCFATGVGMDGRLHYTGPTQSLTHPFMRGKGRREPTVTMILLAIEGMLALLILSLASWIIS